MSSARAKRMLSTLGPARLFATSFLVICSSAIFINDNVLELTWVNGSSMSPTLSPKQHTAGTRDYLLWRKWMPTKGLARGDIVLFASPQHPDAQAAKRIIALEGDTVVLDSRRCPPPSDAAEPAWRAWRGRVEVPPGHVWVEGDNWRSSSDSNYYGPLSKSLITGRALFVVSPWGRCGMKPWEDFKGATRVLAGIGKNTREWTVDGIPIDLAEIGTESVLPRDIRGNRER